MIKMNPINATIAERYSGRNPTPMTVAINAKTNPPAPNPAIFNPESRRPATPRLSAPGAMVAAAIVTRNQNRIARTRWTRKVIVSFGESICVGSRARPRSSSSKTPNMIVFLPSTLPAVWFSARYWPPNTITSPPIKLPSFCTTDPPIAATSPSTVPSTMMSPPQASTSFACFLITTFLEIAMTFISGASSTDSIC